MLSLHLNSVYPLFILSSLEIPEEPPQGCLSIASEERRERFPEAMIVVLLSRLCCLPWHHYHLWKQRYSKHKHSVRLLLCCRCSLHSFAQYTHFVVLLSFWPLRVDCRIVAYQFSNGGHRSGGRWTSRGNDRCCFVVAAHYSTCRLDINSVMFVTVVSLSSLETAIF